jgi:hypothetical protein
MVTNERVEAAQTNLCAENSTYISCNKGDNDAEIIISKQDQNDRAKSSAINDLDVSMRTSIQTPRDHKEKGENMSQADKSSPAKLKRNTGESEIYTTTLHPSQPNGPHDTPEVAQNRHVTKTLGQDGSILTEGHAQLQVGNWKEASLTATERLNVAIRELRNVTKSEIIANDHADHLSEKISVYLSLKHDEDYSDLQDTKLRNEVTKLVERQHQALSGQEDHVNLSELAGTNCLRNMSGAATNEASSQSSSTLTPRRAFTKGNSQNALDFIQKKSKLSSIQTQGDQLDKVVKVKSFKYLSAQKVEDAARVKQRIQIDPSIDTDDPNDMHVIIAGELLCNISGDLTEEAVARHALSTATRGTSMTQIISYGSLMSNAKTPIAESRNNEGPDLYTEGVKAILRTLAAHANSAQTETVMRVVKNLVKVWSPLMQRPHRDHALYMYILKLSTIDTHEVEAFGVGDVLFGLVDAQEEWEQAIARNGDVTPFYMVSYQEVNRSEIVNQNWVGHTHGDHAQPYAVLGLSINATDEDVKAAIKQQSQEFVTQVMDCTRATNILGLDVSTIADSMMRKYLIQKPIAMTLAQQYKNKELERFGIPLNAQEPFKSKVPGHISAIGPAAAGVRDICNSKGKVKS